MGHYLIDDDLGSTGDLLGEVIGRYDQSRDPGLRSAEFSRDGACIAICIRWLGFVARGADFWTGALSGEDRLVNVDQINQLMQRLAQEPPDVRQETIANEIASLGLAKYTAPPKVDIWNTGTIGQTPEDLIDEVGKAWCHCLVSLGMGENYILSAGTGHAIAFGSNQTGGWRLFDPNFGEFQFDNTTNLRTFADYWWSDGGDGQNYAGTYRSFRIYRFHPRLR